MSHIHNIIDIDRHFVIDSVTKAISNESKKLVISQYDHDSERYTFEVPRYIEEHDMSLCDRVEVHFTNITRNKKQQNDDVYIVKNNDITSDRDTVFFSWLISRNATQLIGTLKFSITFICLDDNGTVIYDWGTDIFNGISVIERLNNTATVVESKPDLFEQLKSDIINSIPNSGSGVDKAEVETIIEEYLEANPPTSGGDGVSPTIDVESIEGGHRITITDVNGSTVFDVLNGTDGKDGADGKDGEDGKNGLNGLNGLNGSDGKDGKDGVDGKDGEDGYTPVKGVDYYTESEKEELVQTILSRLLGSDDLRQIVTDLYHELNGTTPSDENEILLVLGGEEDESDVYAKIDESDYPVLNTESPVLEEDGESYSIEVLQ